MLDTLPNELLEEVAKQIVSRNDLISFRSASKTLCKVVTPILFATIDIRANESCLFALDHKPFESLGRSAPLGCFKWVKHVALKASIHAIDDIIEIGCSHRATIEMLDLDGPNGGPSQTHCAGLDKRYCDRAQALGNKLMPLMRQLQQGSLLSFRWELGCSIPEALLGPNGYLPNVQPGIETLALVTGASKDPYITTRAWHLYHFEPFTQEVVVLSNFKRLRSLSWKGIRLVFEIRTLQHFLRANPGTLEKLELGFSSGGMAEHSWPGYRNAASSLIESVLLIARDGTTIVRQTLKSLSLSAASLGTAIGCFQHALNISQLQSLTIHHCASTTLLLEYVVDSGLPIGLSFLELVIDDNATEDGMSSPLTMFLHYFKGLRQLHLLVKPTVSTERYWKAAANHQETLRCFTFQERVVRNRELQEVCLTRKYRPINDDLKLLTSPALESIGVYDHPASLKSHIEHYTLEPSFKMLHFRRSGPAVSMAGILQMLTWIEEGQATVQGRQRGDSSKNMSACVDVFEFAQWAFGPTGLPHLRVLAFGEFSHGELGRYRNRNVLLCRQPLRSAKCTFRMAGKDEPEIFGNIDRPFDLLSACPEQPIL